jgi:hypothetical protein
VCQPLGVYRNCEMLRRVRNVAVTAVPTWVTLAFQTDRSVCPLLTVSIGKQQALELRDYLNDFLAGKLFDWEGRER